MMKRYAFPAILMVALTFAISCNKENRYKGPSTLPTEKVSRIYRTSRQLIETYNSITDTWKTNRDVTGERVLHNEFFWEGDRLTRAHLYGADYTFSYDDVGRIILATSESEEDVRYEYSYNDDGLLSHTLIHAYGIDEHTNYTWANGHLQKYESEWVPYGDERGTIHRETCVFTWNGDILSSTDRHIENADGTSTVSRYDYEYTSIPNPFRNFVCSIPNDFGMIWRFDGIDGLVNNMYSRISNDVSNFSYEYTTSGGRIQTISETQISENTVGPTTMRITSEVLYEIEYAD